MAKKKLSKHFPQKVKGSIVCIYLVVSVLSWNIQNFNQTYLDKSLKIIANIVKCFDIVYVVEGTKMSQWDDLIKLLPSWNYSTVDTTKGKYAATLYDIKRKVTLKTGMFVIRFNVQTIYYINIVILFILQLVGDVQDWL